MQPLYESDAKKDGVISQIIRRLKGLEDFRNSHSVVAHSVPTIPKTATMWHDQALVTVGSALAATINASQLYDCIANQNPPANGDTTTNGFFIRAGTYTLKTLGATAASYGKVDVYIDNVLVSSGLDLYSAGTTLNVILSIPNVVISYSGYHTIKFVVNGKNASSSNYYIVFTKYWLMPASY